MFYILDLASDLGSDNSRRVENLPHSVECWQGPVKSARHFVVQGRVQGVGFRWFVERKASALKLAGFVRNMDNGDVEVVAQGAPAGINQLREELSRGPTGAQVTGVQESD